MTTPHLQPRLVVRNAPEAIDFYVTALGAEELDRYTEPSGNVVHCELSIGDDVFSLTEEDVDHTPSPLAVGGSGLLLRLTVADADADPESTPAEPELPPLHAEAYAAIEAGEYDRAVTAYEQALAENYGAAMDEILRLKPAASKGRYLLKATMATTMGPGIPLDVSKARSIVEEDAPA